MAAVSSSSREQEVKKFVEIEENKMKQKNFPPNPPKIIGRVLKNQFVLVIKILIVYCGLLRLCCFLLLSFLLLSKLES